MNSKSFKELSKGDSIIVFYPVSLIARKELITEIIDRIHPGLKVKVRIIKTDRTRNPLSLADSENYHRDILLYGDQVNQSQAIFDVSHDYPYYEAYININEFLHKHPITEIQSD